MSRNDRWAMDPIRGEGRFDNAVQTRSSVDGVATMVISAIAPVPRPESHDQTNGSLSIVVHRHRCGSCRIGELRLIVIGIGGGRPRTGDAFKNEIWHNEIDQLII